MVFVKFHNMNRKKKFLMSPLNSNSKSFTLQVKTMLQSQFKNVQFSFLLFFNLCSDVVSILLKMSVLSFFLSFFSYAVFNNVQVSSPSFFFFPSFFYCPVRFCFCFHFFLFFFFIFFFIINCSFSVPFFVNLISTSLSLP